MDNADRQIIYDKQDQLLQVCKKAMEYLRILDEVKDILGVSDYNAIPKAVRQLKDGIDRE